MLPPPMSMTARSPCGAVPATPSRVRAPSSAWSRTWTGTPAAELDLVDGPRGVRGVPERVGAHEDDPIGVQPTGLGRVPGQDFGELGPDDRTEHPLGFDPRSQAEQLGEIEDGLQALGADLADEQVDRGRPDVDRGRAGGRSATAPTLAIDRRSRLPRRRRDRLAAPRAGQAAEVGPLRWVPCLPPGRAAGGARGPPAGSGLVRGANAPVSRRDLGSQAGEAASSDGSRRRPRGPPPGGCCPDWARAFEVISSDSSVRRPSISAISDCAASSWAARRAVFLPVPSPS